MRRLFTAAALGAAIAWPVQAQTPPPAAEGRMYAPGSFDSVEIGGSAEVRYVQSDVDQVFIEGGGDVQRTVSVELQGRQLLIRSQGSWKFWTHRRLQVQISSRQLTRLSIQGAADWLAAGAVESPRLNVHISGAGLARFDQLNAEHLAFSVSGAGDGQFRGQVRDLSVQVSGKSDFRGEHLQARTARVTISGIGDVKVWAVDELGITVSGIGQVEYWGNPRIRQRTSGPSTITPRGSKATP
jgi:Putative auto-transporter adhesin, head GIN domain